jgi:hypothetical protein
MSVGNLRFVGERGIGGIYRPRFRCVLLPSSLVVVVVVVAAAVVAGMLMSLSEPEPSLS